MLDQEKNQEICILLTCFWFRLHQLEEKLHFDEVINVLEKFGKSSEENKRIKHSITAALDHGEKTAYCL